MELYTPREVDPLLRASLQDLSYSKIDCYNSCPKRYYFQYVKGDPQPWSPHLALGSAIHSTLEKCVIEKDISYPALTTAFQEYALEFDPDAKLTPDFLLRAETMLQAFSTDSVTDLSRVLAVEQGFELVIGGARIRGFIDRIDDFGDRIRIIDYKAGKSEISAAKIKDSLQLGIYALAARKWWPKRTIEVGMYYLNSKRKKFYTFNDEELEAVYNKVKGLAFVIMNDDNFNKVTFNVRICSWCPYGKSGACTFGYKRLKEKMPQVLEE